MELSMVIRTFAAEDPGSWQHLQVLAGAAEAAGLDRLVLSDHVAMGERLDAYADPANGGVRGGEQPTGPDGLWLDPLICIAHLTAATRRLQFGTNVLLAALRRPVVLAKMAATIDALSDGRFSMGVGVGWQREEYEAAGLDFDQRGALLDESLEVCQALWRDQPADYAGDGLRFSGIHQMPRPTAPGGVPIWVSGTVQPRAMRRLARFGAGWIPWGVDAADVVGGIRRMRDAVAALGRDPLELGVVGTPTTVLDSDGQPDVDRTLEAIPALVEAGVTDVRLRFPAVMSDPTQAAERLADIVNRARATL